MSNISFGTDSNIVRKSVYYEGSDTIYEGMAVCYNQDTTTNWLGWDKGNNQVGTTTAEGNQNEGKLIRVEKPATANLKFLAGFVCPGGWVGTSGPKLVDIYVPNGSTFPVRGTDSFTIGEKLYVVNGDYEVTNDPSTASIPVGYAMETVDRSSTEGLLYMKSIIPGTKIEDPPLTAGSGSLSPLLWGGVDLDRLRNDPAYGFIYESDFLEGVDTTTGDAWTITAATTGSISTVIGVGGELHAAAGASTADQGVNAQLLSACVKPTAGQDIVFEARVQVSHVDNQNFIGIASTDTTLIASGALDESNSSSVGFFTDVNSSTGKGGTITQKAGSNETTEDVIDMPATTWTTLGFRINGVSSVEFLQDGAVVETSSDTDDIADGVEMALSIVCQNEDGANSNTLKVDWVKLAQVGGRG